MGRVGREPEQSRSIAQLKKAYLNTELPHMTTTPQEMVGQQQKSRMGENRSAQGHSFAKMRPTRNSSGNIRDLPAKELQVKRDKLMS